MREIFSPVVLPPSLSSRFSLSLSLFFFGRVISLFFEMMTTRSPFFCLFLSFFLVFGFWMDPLSSSFLVFLRMEKESFFLRGYLQRRKSPPLLPLLLPLPPP